MVFLCAVHVWFLPAIKYRVLLYPRFKAPFPRKLAIYHNNETKIVQIGSDKFSDFIGRTGFSKENIV